MKAIEIRNGESFGVYPSALATKLDAIKKRHKNFGHLTAAIIKLSDHEFASTVGFVYQISMDDEQCYEVEMIDEVSGLNQYQPSPCSGFYFDSLYDALEWVTDSGLFPIEYTPSITDALVFSFHHDMNLAKDIIKAM